VLDLEYESAFSDLHSIGEGGGVLALERLNLSIAALMLRRGKAEEFSAAVKRSLGITLPLGAKCSSNDGVELLGTGPGKWLAIKDAHETDFARQLEIHFEGLASVVDQSSGLDVLRLGGPALQATLEKGVQIDLAPEAFPVGSVAVTSIAHVGVTLWKVSDAPIIDLAVARSLAGSFGHWLQASAAIHGLSVRRTGAESSELETPSLHL
jgi:heterotetrameric sarcosine oxidase gamma subunit